MTPSYNERRAVLTLVVLIPIAIVVFTLNFLNAWSVRQSTNIVDVSASEKNAVITISQTGTEAAIMGVGQARVRLKPGSYYIEAHSAGKSASKILRVTRGSPIDVPLKLIPVSSPVASQDTITYNGFGELAENGFSTTQVLNLKQLFFTYNKDAKTVRITTNTIKNGARDPNSTDPAFTLTFSGYIDSTSFNATVKYTGFEMVELTITNPVSGVMLFNGALPELGTAD
jgi:hypothetical protein